MTALGDAREAVAATLRATVGDVPVYSVPPSRVTPPCIVLAWQGAEQLGPARWIATMRVTVIGPGGDNLAAVEGLEDLLGRIAPVLRGATSSSIEWRAPGTVPYGGTDVLAVDFDIHLDVTL